MILLLGKNNKNIFNILDKKVINYLFFRLSRNLIVLNNRVVFFDLEKYTELGLLRNELNFVNSTNEIKRVRKNGKIRLGIISSLQVRKFKS